VLGNNDFFFTEKAFGLFGNIGMTISAARTLFYTATLSKNGATPQAVAGYGYFSDVANITVPVNLISRFSSGFEFYSPGDTVTIQIFAQHIGMGTNPTIVAGPPLMQAVYQAQTNVNTVTPASGTLTRTSVTDGPELLDPANTYTVANQIGETVDVFTYPATTFQRTFNSTLEPGQSTAPFTGAVYFDVETADVPPPPPFPESPITVTTANEVPIGINPATQYTFTNGGASTMTITLYSEGPPGPTLAPTLVGQSVVAPSAGFTGYTAAFA
jgi:hypothetical protein